MESVTEAIGRSGLILGLKVEEKRAQDQRSNSKHCKKSGDLLHYAHMHVVTLPCLTLCDPMDCRPPGSSVHGVFQAKVLEWVAISFCTVSSQPRDRTHVSHVSLIGRWILYH